MESEGGVFFSFLFIALSPGLFHSLVLEICQEDNLTQRRKDAKKNQVFRTEDAKIFGLNCGFALAIFTLLGNESALPLSLLRTS
jgi:hypothetical protein